MKIILSTPNFNVEQISNLTFDKETGTISFDYNNKKYSVLVEEALGCYVKVFENDEIEIISQEAIL